MLLEQYAAILEEHVRLDMALALRTIEQGGVLEDLTNLLRQQTESKLTVEIEDFLDDLKTRTTSVRNSGRARIIECASTRSSMSFTWLVLSALLSGISDMSGPMSAF